MINYNDKIFSQIKDFIKGATKTELEIYNKAYMVRPPKKVNRIEFCIDSIRSNGHNYKTNDKSGNKYSLGANSMYYAQLEIRVIDTPIEAQKTITSLVAGLNHSDMRNSFMPFISVFPSRLRQSSVTVKEDGVIYNMERILVEISFMYDSEFNIDWFNKVEHTSNFK